MTELTSETRDQLKTISTATLMSCLYKRGLRNQFIQDVRPLNPNAGTMVGEAFTLRYMPAREDLNPMTVFQNPRASAAQGGRAVPARGGARHGQPQGRARRVGGLDPDLAADGARRRRAW